MSARPRRPAKPFRPASGPDRAPSSPWAIRVIVAVAVLIVVAALVYTIATGTLFSTPRHS